MARGQSSAADTQLKTTNAVAGQEGQKANDLENKLVPGYTSMMDTGFTSPEEEGAAETSIMGAATQPFESAGFKAANRAAATRNPADLTAQEDQLALDEGRTAGTAAEEFENQRAQNELSGMYGLTNLQQGDQRAMEQMYGLGPPTLGARAAGPGWSQGFKDVGTTISSFGKQS